MRTGPDARVIAVVGLFCFCAGLYTGFDDADAGGDEVMDPRSGSETYNCPFCGEDFDFVGLCCHIDDEHAVEANTGVRCSSSIQTFPSNFCSDCCLWSVEIFISRRYFQYLLLVFCEEMPSYG